MATKSPQFRVHGRHDSITQSSPQVSKFGNDSQSDYINDEHIDSDEKMSEYESAGALGKGDHVVIKGQACRITECKQSKPGKHGHSKVFFAGIGTFTGKKLEMCVPAKTKVEIPQYEKKDYQVLDVDSDGFVELLDLDTNQIRSDYQLFPQHREIDHQVMEKVSAWEATIIITLIRYKHDEGINSFKQIE